jgi:hypothetical protein
MPFLDKLSLTFIVAAFVSVFVAGTSPYNSLKERYALRVAFGCIGVFVACFLARVWGA